MLQDVGPISSIFGLRHEEENSDEVGAYEHRDDIKGPVDAESLNDERGQHRTELVAAQDGEAIHGDLSSTIMQEENVGDCARDDGFDWGFEDTEKGATDEKRGVSFSAGDSQPDTSDAHQKGGKEVHWSSSVLDCERHPECGGYALTDEGGAVGVSQLLERSVKENRTLHHPSGHDGPCDGAEEGVGKAVRESCPFLDGRPAKGVVRVTQGRLRHEQDVAVTSSDVLELMESLRDAAMLSFLVVEDFCSWSGFEDGGNGVDGLDWG